MIVQPNFLDHWKTKMLEKELGDDPRAAHYVLRLWGHCQQQQSHKFDRLSAPALAGICHFPGSPEMLWMAMQSSGFLILRGEVAVVHDWDAYNGTLISNWKNGRKGGRPIKSHGLSHGDGNPSNLSNPSDPSDRKVKTGEPVDVPLALAGTEFSQAWDLWLAYRRERKLPVPKAISVRTQFDKLSELGRDRAIAAIRYSISQNYQGIFEEKSNGTDTHTQRNGRGFEQSGDYGGIKNKG